MCACGAFSIDEVYANMQQTRNQSTQDCTYDVLHNILICSYSSEQNHTTGTGARELSESCVSHNSGTRSGVWGRNSQLRGSGGVTPENF